MRTRSLARLVAIALPVVVLAAGEGPAVAATGATTSRVSVSSGGNQLNGLSEQPLVSATGRYVAFFSEASNVVPGDTNGVADVFQRDRLSGVTRRVSVGLGGVPANERSFAEAMSPDGRYVVFTSAASNLVTGDTNGVVDVFIRDMQAGRTQRVSVSSAEQQANADSINFASAVSPDGRYVAFSSTASNLVPGDTNGPFSSDVFVRDRQSGTTSRASVSSAEQQANADSFAAGISANGRYVLFSSFASNLVAGDTNFVGDAFLRDRQAGVTHRVSVGSGGQQAIDENSLAAAITPDGRYVLMSSAAPNLVGGDTNGAFDVFVRDTVAGLTRRVSLSTSGAQGNGNSLARSISSDGRYVAFDSLATNLVPGDTNHANDVFVRDRLADLTTRVSVSSARRQGNGDSSTASISADGRHVAFASSATNLVAGDTNGAVDVFARDESGDVH